MASEKRRDLHLSLRRSISAAEKITFDVERSKNLVRDTLIDPALKAKAKLNIFKHSQPSPTKQQTTQQPELARPTASEQVQSKNKELVLKF